MTENYYRIRGSDRSVLSEKRKIIGMAATAKRSHLAMTQQISSSLKMSDLIHMKHHHHCLILSKKEEEKQEVRSSSMKEREREKEVMLL
ncbi:unnamed protein product [Trifolium pratense]|uniref:Uncharacterized protein n=1 Tax=Trifolium pratense TaxID=57577 RepID=A0ACB0K3X0_TRIPR|nr:unnamed protein product [Trifolium pratense]